MDTATRRTGPRPALVFGIALAWAVVTWVTVALVTDVDRDTPALWIGLVATLAGPPLLLVLAALALVAARRTAGPLAYSGGTLLLAALVALAGAGAFLYPFNTDDSRFPVLGALSAPWYIVGILYLVAGVLLLIGALLRARRSSRGPSRS
jgi:cytochrome bd-type quinol oxidase subunit 2